jgi:hypothetical protein
MYCRTDGVYVGILQNGLGAEVLKALSKIMEEGKLGEEQEKVSHKEIRLR